MHDIRLDTIGKIQEGEHAEWFVKVEDDHANTGGYLVLIFRSLDAGDNLGYDDWCETFDGVKGLFSERKWKVLWIEK